MVSRPVAYVLLDLLRERGPLTTAQAAEALGAPPRRVSRYAGWLATEGLTNRERLYIPSAEAVSLAMPGDPLAARLLRRMRRGVWSPSDLAADVGERVRVVKTSIGHHLRAAHLDHRCHAAVTRDGGVITPDGVIPRCRPALREVA